MVLGNFPLYGQETTRGKELIDIILANAAQYTHFTELGLSPNALDLGFFQLKWYSLAYLFGILIAYWYLSKLIKEPGAPLAQRHADDMIFWATLGIILGGRLGYVFFYSPELLSEPLKILQVWNGGMSLHGGMLGVILALWWITRKEKLSFLRVCDYVACAIPFGLFFGRLANFVNGELWGRATDVPWAIIFPAAYDAQPRHPCQLYEAGMEGLLMFVILTFMFWKTNARYKPGLLVGVAAVDYGTSRFLIEFVREPDFQLAWLVEQTGFSMGQWLSTPMILIGLWLVLTAKKRSVKLESEEANSKIA